MSRCKIAKIVGREILDSRGNPTIEAEVHFVSGIYGRASVPSGASTGTFEAKELRDEDNSRFLGKGVKKAVENINSIINKALQGMDGSNISSIDKAMINLDGTKDKSRLGANAILAVSLATVRANANSQDVPLYKFLGGVSASRLPIPLMNILNGGSHATNNLDIQEFMIMPIGAKSFKEALQSCVEVYQNLKKILEKKNLSTGVGDEGGFAPNLKDEVEALNLIIEAIKKSGYECRKDFMIALDAASSEWKTNVSGYYKMPKSKREFTNEQLINHWKFLVENFPIISIEDPLDEEDWEGWNSITKVLGDKIQLVGDDLFVTNLHRIKKGIKNNCANSVLIKPNQIGTVTETLDAIKLAHNSGYSTIISHRSGETEDTFISDLAVATNAGQIKAGAPSRGERIAKYNQLLRIEEELEESANFFSSFYKNR